MTCNRCGAWTFTERDPYGWTDEVCANGHRVTLNAPEPMPLLMGEIGQRPKLTTSEAYDTLKQQRRAMKWDQ